jgi:hypothetical protein
MTSWDLTPEQASMYPAFIWEIGTSAVKRIYNGYMGVQCARGKVYNILFSLWDSCGTTSSAYPCYTNFKKKYWGPSPERPNNVHRRPAPAHPNCIRNCQDCSGAFATGTKCFLQDELTALALPCTGKYEMRVRMTHPQRTHKYSSAIDQHNKEFSVTGAEFTVTYWDLERDMGWVVGAVVLEGVPPSGGFTQIGTFYEFFGGTVAGCELTTDERKHRICTQRVTRELIFHDTPRTLSGWWASAKESAIFPSSSPGSCQLSNSYALRRGLFTSEYSPGTPRENDPVARGFTRTSRRRTLIVPYFSPYVADENGNLPTPAPSPPPTPGPTNSQSTCPTFENNYDYHGNTVHRLTRISSAASCSVSCAERYTGFFSYSPSQKKCWCKKSKAGRRHRGDRVSGVASKACGAQR